MTDLVGLDGVFQRAFDMSLPHHVLERLRTILSIQCLCHSVASPIPLVRTSVYDIIKDRKRRNAFATEPLEAARQTLRIACTVAPRRAYRHLRRKAHAPQRKSRRASSSATASSVIFIRKNENYA